MGKCGAPAVWLQVDGRVHPRSSGSSAPIEAVRINTQRKGRRRKAELCFQGSACSAPASLPGSSSHCWRRKASPSKRCGAARRKRRRSWRKRWTSHFTPTGSTTCCCIRTWIWCASTFRRLWRGRLRSKHWVSIDTAAAAAVVKDDAVGLVWWASCRQIPCS